jgi:hypothetical protein
VSSCFRNVVQNRWDWTRILISYWLGVVGNHLIHRTGHLNSNLSVLHEIWLSWLWLKIFTRTVVSGSVPSLEPYTPSSYSRLEPLQKLLLLLLLLLLLCISVVIVCWILCLLIRRFFLFSVGSFTIFPYLFHPKNFLSLYRIFMSIKYCDVLCHRWTSNVTCKVTDNTVRYVTLVTLVVIIISLLHWVLTLWCLVSERSLDLLSVLSSIFVCPQCWQLTF